MSVLLEPIHSQEAEDSIISAIMLDNSAFEAISNTLSPEDFYSPSNRKIYAAMADLISRDVVADFITLGEKLDDMELMRKLAFIIENNTGTNWSIYTDIVKTRSMERTLAHTGSEIIHLAHQRDKDIAEKVDLAQSSLTKLSFNKSETMRPHMEIVKEVLDDQEYRLENEGEIIGLETGFQALDNRFMGLSPGNLVVIAARPSMGKSSLVQNIIEHNLLKGLPCLLFSLEMSENDVIKRMICSLGGIDYHAMRTGHSVDTHNVDRFSAAIQKMKDWRFFIDSSTTLTIEALKSRARRVWRENKDLAFIAVDYLQLMSGTGDIREQEISNISRELKKLAGELEIPIIALSQLNRSVDNRTNKEPFLSDLRESGAIEQDADIIIFIYRDEIYNPDKTNEKGVARIITRKFRNGEIGTDYLGTDLAHLRFTNTDFVKDDSYQGPRGITGYSKK